VEATRVLDFTIPAEGVRFRLKARESRHVIYSRPEQEPLVGHFLGPAYDDQIFVLLHGKNENAGMYAIKSWACGKVIYSRTAKEPYVSNVYGDGKYADNWFQFPPDEYDKNSFRIYCPASNTVLFSRTSQDPQFGNFMGGKYADQLWHFEGV